MHAISKRLFIVLMLGFAPWLYGASFDCTKAKSVGEKLICEDSELSQKDEELNFLYNQAKSVMGREREFRENNIDAWRWREANCFDRSCLFQWYSSRKTYFQNVVRQADSSQNAVDVKKAKCIKLGLRPGSKDYLECLR